MIESEAQAREYCSERCDSAAMERLERFIRLLIAENKHQNLVSNSSLDHVWTRHLADSLQLLDYVPRETGTWMDLGSGAGFPGLVLAFARTDLSITLVESRKRRIEWLRQVCSEFSVKNCEVAPARLENLETREIAVITARAFAPLDKLLKLSARFSTRSTTWLLPKGRNGAIELSEQPPAIRKMFHVEQSKTDPTAGILIGKGRPTIR